MSHTGGQLHLGEAWGVISKFNYMRLERDGVVTWAWITNITERTANSVVIDYSTDPFRTYIGKTMLGTQFINRSPVPTFRKDKLLGSTQAYSEIIHKQVSNGHSDTRVFVVQRRTGSGEIESRTPVQPSPYQFYMAKYKANDWMSSPELNALLTAISGAQPENIVTMYSIPYMDISTLPTMDLIVKKASGNIPVPGWKFLGNIDPTNLLSIKTDITFPWATDELMRVNHSARIIIPEAGIINIPDNLLNRTDLKLRQDVDLFSGASNYMLMTGDTSYYGLSVRGGSISSIPVISDPMDTYLSQNQNALMVSMLGDVASIGVGATTAMATGGVGAAIGSGQVMSGINGIINRSASIRDMESRPSNPPAFLGTALATKFNNSFWIVMEREKVTNAAQVNGKYGYPYETVGTLTLPGSGFIQTEGCSVTSDGTVPRWAIEEINAIFDNGIRIK